MSKHRGRAICKSDYETSDLLVALDAGHQRHMIRSAPAAHQQKVRLLMQFAGYRSGAGTHANTPLRQAADLDVPDPYYDDLDAFETVHSMVEQATDGLIAAVQDALASAEPAATLRSSVPRMS